MPNDPSVAAETTTVKDHPPVNTIKPSDCHQVAAVIALDPRQKSWHRLLALLGTAAVTLAQAVVLVAAGLATIERACLTNEDCTSRATYCRASTLQCDACSFGYGGACGANVTAAEWLASLPPGLLAGQNGGTISRALPEPADYATHCWACVDLDGHYSWASTSEYNNVYFMGWRDWFALVFVSFVIGLYIADEVRCIKINEVVLSQSKAGLGWRLVIGLVSAVRQFAVLTSLLTSVCIGVLTTGGDVLNVCLNAVALVFLLEVDDAIYAHAMPENFKQWCTGHAVVTVGSADLRMFSSIKLAYVAIPTVGMPLAVSQRLRYPSTGGYGYTAPCLNVLAAATILFNLAEPLAFVGESGQGLRRAARRLVLTALRFIIGAGVWLVMIRIV